MNKKLLAPLAAIALSLLVLVTASFNLGSGKLPGESGTDYFIKSIQADRVLLVEPNLLSFVNPNATDNSVNERLLSALEEIGQSYIVDGARPIQITKNIGTVVPNLVVYVQQKPLQQDAADVVAANSAVTVQ